ncbi:MAG: PA0069 family radical SAM protein [Planctomycetaceae bacterium]
MAASHFKPAPKGRGAHVNPANRFDVLQAEPDFEHLEHDEEYLADLDRPKTVYFNDTSRTVVTENDSPDIPFRYSLNPYRGCSHGCAYCYARPYHEYLGLSAGLDFEAKVFVKLDAPLRFREFLSRPGWKPETITFSGVTDCYQPAEARFRVTRGCLEVALEARQPVAIITKNALVTRDLDLLEEMAALRLVHVALSITTLDEPLARSLEPRTSPPQSRLNAIRELSEAGIPTIVMTAPIIPGLNDSEIPALLRAAADAGARSAGFTLLRLPGAVEPVFRDWLERIEPTRRARVESLIRSTREGRLNDPKFGSRMRGTGPVADQIAATFRLFRRKYGLDTKHEPLDVSNFRPPRPVSGQLTLF